MTFREIIGRWPSMAEMGRDLNTTQKVVQQWSLRNSIPPPWWPRLLAAAQARGIELTQQALEEALATRRPPRVHGDPAEASAA